MHVGPAEVDQTLRHYACSESAKQSALSLGFLKYSDIKIVLTSKVDIASFRLKTNNQA